LRKEVERTSPLNEELEVLKRKHEQLRLDHDATLNDLAIAQSRIREAEKKENSYRIQIARLQQTITKNATNANEVIDSVVIQKTCEIRAKIQSIVGRYCAKQPICLMRKSFPEFKDWDEEWTQKEKNLPSHCSPDDVDAFRQYWLRARIFFILDRDIFRQRIFGVADHLERTLAQFEGDIAKRKQGLSPLPTGEMLLLIPLQTGTPRSQSGDLSQFAAQKLWTWSTTSNQSVSQTTSSDFLILGLPCGKARCPPQSL
jgi:hypothetical protein